VREQNSLVTVPPARAAGGIPPNPAIEVSVAEMLELRSRESPPGVVVTEHAAKGEECQRTTTPRLLRLK
jgi:hypothetical protein